MTIIEYDCDLDMRYKRCSECIRPLCQRDFSKANRNANKWEDINIPEIYITFENNMHNLYLG